jgi:hypothetical protein
MSSQKQVFQEILRRTLRDYIPNWEKGDVSLGVAPKTLQRWIDGKHNPNDGSIQDFLDAVVQIRADFPKDSIEAAYKHVRNGKNHDALETDDLIGADAYNRKFNEWCELANEGSNIWIVQNWISYPNKFTDRFMAALERGANAKLMLLHPSSEFVRERYRFNNASPYGFMAYLSDVQSSIRAQKLEQQPRFELRFFEAPPAYACYVVDENILFAPFWVSHPTSEAPHLQLTSDTAFGRTLMEDVRYLWNRCEAISVERALEVFQETSRGARKYWGSMLESV